MPKYHQSKKHQQHHAELIQKHLQAEFFEKKEEKGK